MKRALLVAFALGSFARPTRAQRPPGADTISSSAVAESLAVMAQLKQDIRKHPKDASLWYRQGMIAWALFDRDRLSPTRTLDWTLLGRQADSSLRIAKSLDPKNPRYTLAAGQYFLGTGLITMRAQSYAMFGEALALTRPGQDSATHAEAALEVGRVYWRRYDAVANAGTESSEAPDVRMMAEVLSKDTADKTRAYDPGRTSRRRPYTRQSVARAREKLDHNWQKPQSGFAGEADYLQADVYLREAFETMPTYGRAYRQLGMLLAERGRWVELAALAEIHLDAVPHDAWTWMTLGLANHRLGDSKFAHAAFDSGLRYMSAIERNRLDRIERVLRPRDTTDALALLPEAYAALERRYWANAAPLWSREDIDPRAEFLARIAFSELRWTVDELSKRGADCDRGNIYIRYGPPDRIASTNGKSTWTYDYSGLSFTFRGAPTYGTSYFSDYGVALVTMDSLPALWDNVNSLFIDSLPAQAARFRAAADSFDVLFASRAPVERINRGTDVKSPIRSDFWLIRDEIVLQRDSLLKTTGDVRRFTKRLPKGTYAYRFEATADGSVVAGRSTGAIAADSANATDFPLRGFGISDVLLATHVEPRGATQRWSDLDVTPLVGTIKRDGELALVWENYEFGNSEGQSKYQVSVTLTAERPLAGRITAKILGSLSASVGRNDYIDGVRFRFERGTAFAPAVADYITISLDKTPAGSYLLTLELTDRVTGKVTSRTRRIVVVD